jgi:multidrug efflux pump
MGVAVFAGMIGVTAFGIFFTPMFYVLLRAMSGNRPLTQHGEATVDQTAPLVPGAHDSEPRPHATLTSHP